MPQSTFPSPASDLQSAAHPQDIFWQTIFERRSIRRFQKRPVPRALLERLLTAAIWAPSAHNRQPWRFAVLTTPESKQKLAQAMAAHWQEDLRASGLEPAAIEHKLQRSFQRITQPPVLVLGSFTLQEMDAYDDPILQQAEQTMASQSLSLALGNLMLAAQHQGLGSCWICAPLFAPAAVRTALHLPEHWQPQALIALGYPDEKRQSQRKPLKEVMVWR